MWNLVFLVYVLVIPEMIATQITTWFNLEPSTTVGTSKIIQGAGNVGRMRCAMLSAKEITSSFFTVDDEGNCNISAKGSGRQYNKHQVSKIAINVTQMSHVHVGNSFCSGKVSLSPVVNCSSLPPSLYSSRTGWYDFSSFTHPPTPSLIRSFVHLLTLSFIRSHSLPPSLAR